MLKVQALILSWYSPETWNHLHTISQNRAFSGATFRQNSCVHSYSKKVLHAVYVFTPFKKYSKKELQKVEFWKRLFKVSWRQCCLQKNGLDEWLIKKIWNWLFSHFQEEVYWEGPADSADSVSICWGLDDVAPKTRRKLKDQNSCWKTTNISSNNHSTRNMSFYFRKENYLDFHTTSYYHSKI